MKIAPTAATLITPQRSTSPAVKRTSPASTDGFERTSSPGSPKALAREVASPRDASTGLATGRRQHKPMH